MAELLVLLAQKKILLIVMSSTFVAVILFLMIVDRKLSKKKPEVQVLEQPKAENEMEKMLRINTSDFTLEDVDSLSRLFFSQKYGMDKDLEYEDMFEYFTQSQNKKAAEFAKRMLEYSYSGDNVDKYKIAMLISLLKRIYEEERDKSEASVSNSISIIERISKFISRKNNIVIPLQPQELRDDVLEEVKNLKPITIKPESLIVKNNGKSRLSSPELDDLERIKMNIQDKKSALI